METSVAHSGAPDVRHGNSPSSCKAHPEAWNADLEVVEAQPRDVQLQHGVNLFLSLSLSLSRS
jgi:hypothetical protein